MIHISQAAAKEIKRLKQVRQQPDNLLRLSVQKGGCSGLFYNLELDSVKLQSNAREKYESDRTCDVNGLIVLIDEQTYSYIQDLKLDYSEDLMGGGFRFQNPNATSTCGCGLSFTID